MGSSISGGDPSICVGCLEIDYSSKSSFFLWLLSHNKLLTRNNMGKRRHFKDWTCLFCKEDESIYHLFFGCVVAKQIWELIFEVVGMEIDTDYESVANPWLCNKKFRVVNMISSAVCWGI
jgi:hypothetical protein